MENNKSNNKLVITLIIIIVLLLTGGGFLVYTLLSNNPNFNLGGSDSSNSQLSGEENNINNNIDGNITQESIQTNSNTAEFYIRYTKKDENGNIIWTYTTQSDVAGQLQTLGTLKETTDKIYINDKGTIVVLNKETGKVIWKNENHKNTKGLYTANFFDNSENIYLYSNANPNSLIIIDKNGKTKKTITHPNMNDYCLEGVYYEFTDDNYLGIGDACGNNPKPNIYINLTDYSIKTTNYNSYVVETLDENITVERYTNSETTEYYLQYTKKENNKTVWTYTTESDYTAQFDKTGTIKNFDDVLYIADKGNIVSLNKISGKVNWKNTESNNSPIISSILDSNKNLYIHTTYGEIKVIDSNGKTKTTIEHDMLSATESNFKINNNQLIVTLPGDGELTVNLSNYSIKTTK